MASDMGIIPGLCLLCFRTGLIFREEGRFVLLRILALSCKDHKARMVFVDSASISLLAAKNT